MPVYFGTDIDADMNRLLRNMTGLGRHWSGTLSDLLATSLSRPARWTWPWDVWPHNPGYPRTVSILYQGFLQSHTGWVASLLFYFMRADNCRLMMRKTLRLPSFLLIHLAVAARLCRPTQFTFVVLNNSLTRHFRLLGRIDQCINLRFHHDISPVDCNRLSLVEGHSWPGQKGSARLFRAFDMPTGVLARHGISCGPNRGQTGGRQLSH